MKKLITKFSNAFLCHGILVWIFDSANFHSKAILPKNFIVTQRGKARSGIYSYY